MPDIVRRFFVICTQTYEAYIDSICVHMIKNQSQQQVYGRFQKVIFQILLILFLKKFYNYAISQITFSYRLSCIP